MVGKGSRNLVVSYVVLPTLKSYIKKIKKRLTSTKHFVYVNSTKVFVDENDAAK